MSKSRLEVRGAGGGAEGHVAGDYEAEVGLLGFGVEKSGIVRMEDEKKKEGRTGFRLSRPGRRLRGGRVGGRAGGTSHWRGGGGFEDGERCWVDWELRRACWRVMLLMGRRGRANGWAWLGVVLLSVVLMVVDGSHSGGEHSELLTTSLRLDN